jgi:hypothetical protein
MPLRAQAAFLVSPLEGQEVQRNQNDNIKLFDY